MIGQTISRYRILEKIGEGGMGVVYKAEDTKLHRRVALKFLPSSLQSSTVEKERFIHEAEAAAALDHANICTIYEIDEVDGHLFIAMAYVEGRELAHMLDSGPLSLDQAMDLASQIAAGLQAAHKKGIVHRDMKSGNVLVTEEGQAKIMDFGLAKRSGRRQLTQVGSTLGTVPYMSPEQARGDEVDHRTDIWSFGVLLYEMLAGRLPFRSDYSEALVYSILNEDPPPIETLRADLPADLARIVKTCLQKDREARYDSVADVLADLRQTREQNGTGQPVRPQAASRRNFLRWGLIGAAAVVITVILLLILPPGNDQTARIESLAVLPFENLTGDPEQEYFVDGMTDALISDLAKIGALRVISRTSVMQYKDATKSLPQIARELNVAAVIEGTVMRSEERVRITAQLIDARADRHLWSGRYERDLKDILQLQSEVTRAIAGEIKLTLSPREEQRLASAPSVNRKAYELYLKGKYHWNKRTEEALTKAIEYYRQSIEEDPAYAWGYAGLAECYTVLSFYSRVPPKESFPKAQAAAARAIAMDSTVADAYAALGDALLHYDRDWEGAQRAFHRALELKPGHATARTWFAEYLIAMGRYEEAIAEVKRARELDPLSLIINSSVGWNLYNAGRYDEAITVLQKTLDLNPDFPNAHFVLGQTYAEKSMYEEAIAELQTARSLAPTDMRHMQGLGYAYARSGKIDEAYRMLNELKDLEKDGYQSAYHVAVVYAGLGETDQMMLWLEKAMEEGAPYMPFCSVAPVFDSVRSDPRFTALLRQMGLPVLESQKLRE
jgi:serine/threonine-protein kinase